MITTFFLLAAVSLGSQEAQAPGVAMAERIAAQVQIATPEGCATALEEASDLNSEALFTGASICAVAGREDDATFLILVGQARAMADMALVMPESLPPPDANGVTDLSAVPAPPFGVIDLYSFIYAYAGGAGPTDAYRDHARIDQLFTRVREWVPRRPLGYNPGWEGSRTIDDVSYAESVREQVAAREDQLARIAILLRDDEYFALEQELEALIIANDATFHEGTPASDRFDSIRARQAEIAERLSPAQQ